MTRRTKWQRERPTLGQVQAAIAWQAPPGTTFHVEPERAAPVQHESRDQARLTTMARGEWWGPGYRHHEQSTWSAKEARRRWRQGVTQGWPDVTQYVPAIIEPQIAELQAVGKMIGTLYLQDAILLALELKAEHRRPKRDLDLEWWLDWRPKWDGLGNPPTHYGLTLMQAQTLRLLAGSGYRTMVAYGADEAFAWLAEMCGPEPAVLPDWGW